MENSADNQKTLTGKCHCGDLSYTAQPNFQFEFLCFCTDCRRLQGGGHLAGIVLEESAVTFKGTPSVYEYAGGSGKTIASNFCGKCGTDVYAKAENHPGKTILRANTLDDTKAFKPKTNLFPESAHSWDQPPSL